MPIQLRFVTLIASVMAILLAGLRVQQQWDEKETRLLQEAMAKERTKLVSKMLDVTGEPMRVLIADYTLWDDMVNFVAKPDAEWSRINITETGLSSHHVDAAWVFRPDLTEVFAGTLENRTELRAFPLAPEVLAKVANGFSETHFFVTTPKGLLEIRGAPVRPTDPKAVIPQPFGWMFAARLWDESHLQRLALLTDSQVRLVPAGATDADTPDDTLAITTHKALPDWQGRTVRELHVHYLPLALNRMRANNRIDLLISSAFSILALVAFYFATRQWVVRPLGVLEASLAQRSAEPLAQLHQSSREFSRLGRLVEQSLQHEQTLQQVFAAFNAIEDAVLIVDTGTQRITHVNDGAVQLLGYRHDELHGKALADLQAEPAAPAPPGTSWYRCQDGRLVEVEIREQALPAPAVAPLRVIVARDVTQLRRQEQQRLQAQRLESLGNLAGGIAHDMNNMLTPITMFLEDLRHADSRPSPELLASVRSSVKRGADMLRQLLTFGRGIAGDHQPLAVTHLLDEISRIVASTFPKSIQFESRPACSLSSIVGDATQLHQVLLNLCVNARDAMPNGGRLRLGADDLLLDAGNAAEWPDSSPGRYVLIEVADTGSGIPPELLGRIFEPFFTTKSAELGTGLGLSTSLGIVRSHGGSIRVESTPGVGTRFRLILPANDKTAALDPVETTAVFAGLDRTVLIVEDEANIRLVLEKMLQRLSFRLLIAADGEAGLALFHAHRRDIDLVMSDLHMPGVDGLVMIQTIRRETSTLPIVVMSGRVDDRTRRAITALRLTWILDKPFDHAEIVQALRKALG